MIHNKLVTGKENFVNYSENRLNRFNNKIRKGLFLDSDSWRVKAIDSARDEDKPGLLIYYCEALRWEGVSGTFTDEDFTLTLRNEFDKKNKNYFLAHMILTSCDDILISPFEADISDENIFDFIYIYMFKKALKEAYISGYYKCYQTFYRNDDRVKGNIDISRHIKQNMGMTNGKIAYSYRENSFDNPINKLIISTFELLKKKHCQIVSRLLLNDNDFRLIIHNIKVQCPSWNCIDDRKLLRKCLNPIYHPLYCKYEELRNLCIQIFRNEGLSFLDESYSETEKSPNILFYLPDLWEDYLEKILVLGFGDEFRVLSQKKVNLLVENSTRIYEKYPDYILYNKDNKVVAVFDAKFKPSYSKFNVNKEYFKNDIQHLIIYKEILNAHKAAILYPHNPSHKKESKNQFSISDVNNDIFSIRGLTIPEIGEDTTFYQWQKSIRENESSFIRELRGLINLKNRINQRE